MPINDRKGAVALIIWRGLFLLQLRENKPDIKNPCKWALFGGGQKRDEKLQETICRELPAEIGFSPSKLRFLELSERGNSIHVVYLTDEEVQSIVLGEGQLYAWFALGQLLRIPDADVGGELSYYRQKHSLLQSLLENEVTV